ncbi:MAG: DHA2 family efflux MFS transporter permease subunit [Candidatus Omnitrophica bacterium]|nr:DHA2 family efflux MFS transporter permease subunit [Candidatus Omnitrophota bacterium]
MNPVNKWIIAFSVVLPTLLEVIDTSVVNVSLGHIRGSLSAGLDESTWTITAYLVSNAIIIPLTGWLSRVFGRKRYLLASIALFTVSSFMCGSAKTLSALVFFRIIQGIGGGGLQPLSQAILLETFPPKEHGMAMAMFGIGIMFGPIIGPVLGGWITDNWSWNWIFYINIPIGILSMLMVAFFIKDPEYLLKKVKQKVDYWGLGLVVVGIGALQIVLDKGEREDWFSSAFIMRLSIISAIALIAFVIVELKKEHPILDLREFKNVVFASANVIQCVVFFVLYASITILPIFCQQLMGYDAFLAGMVLAPGGLATLLVMPITGILLTRKINPKSILFIGLIITAYSILMMTKFNLYIDYDSISWARIVMGVGLALVFIPLNSMAFATIPKEEMGNATSIFSLLRNIAGSVGIAFMTTTLAQRAQFHQFRFSERLHTFDPRYQLGMQKAMGILHTKTGAASAGAANGLVYQQLMKQAALQSFIDTFYLSMVIMLLILPLVFLLKRPAHSLSGAALH